MNTKEKKTNRNRGFFPFFSFPFSDAVALVVFSSFVVLVLVLVSAAPEKPIRGIHAERRVRERRPAPGGDDVRGGLGGVAPGSRRRSRRRCRRRRCLSPRRRSNVVVVVVVIINITFTVVAVFSPPAPPMRVPFVWAIVLPFLFPVVSQREEPVNRFFLNVYGR